MNILSQRSCYSIAADCVIFGYIDNQLKVALIKRKNEPFKDYWALPGGFLEEDETVEQAAARELKEETGIHDIYLEQFHVFSKPDRDPRGRVISVAFFALIAADKIELAASVDAMNAQWFLLHELPTLAFDHDRIYTQALDAMRVVVTTKPIIFELLPHEFTLTMLQKLYEQIFGCALDKRNFRKKIKNVDFIQETTKQTRGVRHRPAQLYKFKKPNLREVKISYSLY